MDEKQSNQARANADQLGSALRDSIAPTIAAYYRALVKEGVPASEASLLTSAMQTSFMEVFFGTLKQKIGG